MHSGCKTEVSNPMAKQITPHLAELRDNLTQQQMFKVIGECETLREEHGTEAVADALKWVASNNPEVQDQALLLLMRYVSVEQYGEFAAALKRER